MKLSDNDPKNRCLKLHTMYTIPIAATTITRCVEPFSLSAGVGFVTASSTISSSASSL